MQINGAYGGAVNNLLAKQDKNFKELSTGKKINSAADNVAGLSISKRLEAQSKEFSTKVKGLQTQISFNQVGDAGLSSINDSLKEIRTLAIQYNNDTLSDSDKEIIQNRAEQILQGIDDIANSTEFNTKKMITEFSSEDLNIKDVLTSGNALKEIDAAISKISEKRSEFGSEINGLKSEIAKIRVAHENSVAANSRIEDADMALATLENVKNNIMISANRAVNAQSRVSQNRITDLLND